MVAFWLAWRFCDLEGAFTFQYDSGWFSCGSLWGCWCWAGGPWSYDFGVGFFFLGLFLFGAVCGWISGEVVSMVDVTGGFLGGCSGFWRILGEVTEVHALNIVVEVDFEDFFHNFSDGGKFLKEWNQGKKVASLVVSLTKLPKSELKSKINISS